MKRREFLISAGAAIGVGGLVITGCSTTPPRAAATNPPGTRRDEIDAGADGALTRLYSAARGSRELAARSRGILIFPRVLSAGLGVGGEFGDGVLRSGERTFGYYRLVGGSLGWQIGAQSQAVILMFLTEDALDRFRRSSGWTVGADATVSVARIGASGDIDTNTIRQSVIGFALTNVGLYAGIKLDGSKITRLDL